MYLQLSMLEVKTSGACFVNSLNSDQHVSNSDLPVKAKYLDEGKTTQ